MKIIDLLNKIANGEEVPRLIEINDIKYEFSLRSNDIDDLYLSVVDCKSWNNISSPIKLNDEVEIIEEPHEHKIPEKLDYKYENIYHNISKCKHSEIRIIDKINEILDYLKEIK